MSPTGTGREGGGELEADSKIPNSQKKETPQSGQSQPGPGSTTTDNQLHIKMSNKGELTPDLRQGYYEIKEKEEQNNVTITIKVYQKETGQTRNQFQDEPEDVIK